jgi:hypothetical protein
MVFVPSGVWRHALGGVMLRSELLGAWAVSPRGAARLDQLSAVKFCLFYLLGKNIIRGILVIEIWDIATHCVCECVCGCVLLWLVAVSVRKRGCWWRDVGRHIVPLCIQGVAVWP